MIDPSDRSPLVLPIRPKRRTDRSRAVKVDIFATFVMTLKCLLTVNRPVECLPAVGVPRRMGRTKLASTLAKSTLSMQTYAVQALPGSKDRRQCLAPVL
jgi:hypothetical protein